MVQPPPESPLITVLTPTFDRPAYLSMAIKSVLGQTWCDLELIVCDDGDNEGIVAEFDDERLIYLGGGSASGVLRNSQRGFARARGKYVATLFDDDLWHRDFLETLVSALELDPSLSVAFSQLAIIDAEGRVDEQASATASRTSGQVDLTAGRHTNLVDLALVTRSIPIAVAVLMRKTAVDLLRVPPEAGRVYDLWLASQLALSGGAAWYEPRRLAFYRAHDSSCSALGGPEMHAAFSYCWRHFAAMPDLQVHRAVMTRRGAIGDALLATALVRAGRHAEARSTARRGINAVQTPETLGAAALAFLPSHGATKALRLHDDLRSRWRRQTRHSRLTPSLRRR